MIRAGASCREKVSIGIYLIARIQTARTTMLTFKLIFLLLVANGAPILLNKILSTRYAWPVDGGAHCRDGRPLLGPSKTWRGLAAAVLLTGPAAALVGLPFGLGVLFGGCAMLGDLLSSFLKRRAGVPPSGMALGLDQVPESLFPLLAVRGELALDAGYIAWLVMAFLLLELVLSRLLYALRIREQPH
jgi:hypothetical protein